LRKRRRARMGHPAYSFADDASIDKLYCSPFHIEELQ